MTSVESRQFAEAANLAVEQQLAQIARLEALRTALDQWAAGWTRRPRYEHSAGSRPPQLLSQPPAQSVKQQRQRQQVRWVLAWAGWVGVPRCLTPSVGSLQLGWQV